MDKHEKIYEIMLNHFDKLPHPIHEPRRCEMYLKMMKAHFYRKEQEAKRKKQNDK